MRKGLVIIETRPNVGLGDTITSHMGNLGIQWGIKIFCSKNNMSEISELHHTLIFELQDSMLNESQYNKILTSYLFWDLLPFDKVLITQTDAKLLRPGIGEFMDFDYVGSPWGFQTHGGNGGFSLRTVSVMKQICNDFRYDPSMGNEDVFFSNLLKAYPQYGRLAPREVCKRFAMETILEYGTLGVHAIEKYHDKETCNKILTQYD